MINTILGKKVTQSQKFLEDGRRVPVTMISTGDNYVVAQVTQGIQLGFGNKKHITKPIQGILKKAGVSKNLRFFRTIATTEAQNGDETLKPGTIVKVSDVVKPGDVVQVSGISKGKGFAGGVKRHHFKGGPRTHGQSDRERAPGSIGQTTTPGRVYKGKRMAGRMGSDRVTIKNLQVLQVVDDLITIGGLVPGGRNNLLMITKIGEAKKFVPLYGEKPAVTEDTEKSTETQNLSVSENLSDSVVARETSETQEVKEDKGEQNAKS